MRDAMVVYHLTNRVYTPWGKQYSMFHWRPSWWVFITIAAKYNNKEVNHIIYWFDTNILNRISKDTRQTLDVRIRIVCGMINKLNPAKMSRPMKQEFMECIWDAYMKFSKDYYEYHCKYELCLPF